MSRTSGIRSRRLWIGATGVLAVVLAAASIAYACTVMTPQANGNMVITPNTNAVGGSGSATDVLATGECRATINGCMNAPKTGDLHYARCGPLEAVSSHCGAVGVDGGGAHTFHNTLCNSTTGTPLDPHSRTGGTNDVTIAASAVPTINTVMGEGRMPGGLNSGIYVVCAVVSGTGGPTHEMLFNFFTYI